MEDTPSRPQNASNERHLAFVINGGHHGIPHPLSKGGNEGIKPQTFDRRPVGFERRLDFRPES